MASLVPESSETGFNNRFFDYFKQEISGRSHVYPIASISADHTTALQEQIDNLSKIPSGGTARIDAVNQSLAGITKLQREVSDASSQLPTHSQKSYSDVRPLLHLSNT